MSSPSHFTGNLPFHEIDQVPKSLMVSAGKSQDCSRNRIPFGIDTHDGITVKVTQAGQNLVTGQPAIPVTVRAVGMGAVITQDMTDHGCVVTVRQSFPPLSGFHVRILFDDGVPFREWGQILFPDVPQDSVHFLLKEIRFHMTGECIGKVIVQNLGMSRNLLDHCPAQDTTAHDFGIVQGHLIIVVGQLQAEHHTRVE